MAWVYLVIAGVLEVGWALMLKQTYGFTKPVPSALTIVLMLFSFGLLAQALKTLPVGTGYAVWTGIGAMGTVLVGMIWGGEGFSWARLACVCLIVSGIVGIKLLTPPDAAH